MLKLFFSYFCTFRHKVEFIYTPGVVSFKYSYVKMFCSKLAFRIYGRLRHKLHFIQLAIFLFQE